MSKIKEIREARGLSVQELADLAETNIRQIYRLEKGERKLTDVWLVKLSKALSCEPADLIDGAESSILPKGAIPITNMHSLPVLGRVQAGMWIEVFDDQTQQVDLKHIDVPLNENYSHKDHFLLEVVGDSMNKLIPDGYYATCVNINGITHEFPNIGDIVVCERSKYDGQMKEVTIKKYGFIDGQHALIPESFNETHQVIFPEREMEEGTNIQIVAKVVGAVIAGF